MSKHLDEAGQRIESKIAPRPGDHPLLVEIARHLSRANEYKPGGVIHATELHYALISVRDYLRATASPPPHVEEERCVTCFQHTKPLPWTCPNCGREYKEEKAAGEAEPNPCNWCDRCRRCCDANESACRECGERTRALARPGDTEESAPVEFSEAVALVELAWARKASANEHFAMVGAFQAGKASAAREVERLRAQLSTWEPTMRKLAPWRARLPKICSTATSDLTPVACDLADAYDAIPPELRPEKA